LLGPPDKVVLGKLVEACSDLAYRVSKHHEARLVKLSLLGDPIVGFPKRASLQAQFSDLLSERFAVGGTGSSHTLGEGCPLATNLREFGSDLFEGGGDLRFGCAKPIE
jgi:hypothetical protein